MGDTAMTCNDPTDMPVGKVIGTAATVLINNIPAAKQTDKVVGVDTHIVMVPSPGGPVPTPLPHPFTGMLDSGLSTSVKIEGMAAATVDSQASNMPPHIPTPPGTAFQKPPSNKAKIIMGSPNVLIGNGGGGGGSGGGGGGSQTEGSSDEAPVEEQHYLDVNFVDGGGNPVTGAQYTVTAPDGSATQGSLGGRIRQSGVQEGNYEVALRAIVKAVWSKPKARDGEKVKMQVETAGIDDGETAAFEVWERNSNKADRLVFSSESSSVSGDKVESEWTYEHPSDGTEGLDRAARGFRNPSYYFTVKIGDTISRSGILDYKDYVEIELRDDEDKPVKGAKYTLRLSSGEVRQGTLNNDGYGKEEKIPPGRCHVSFEDTSDVVGPE
jgi:uncharacterized Zn-binding protein involved in type VI secretion